MCGLELYGYTDYGDPNGPNDANEALVEVDDLFCILSSKVFSSKVISLLV
eukprot:CAMPEP_0116900482 /NCGR_PEP_ID=MMETSP0467-20121206/8740_1 /TAXON_ID=283647 /ORGANISM="Mesodinium pulex, Strain SPMC105" /LENGTH=49 /DNA_ID=CAMNT_0004573725 /DNA_START=568 /DNA_END=717 /DNA_ORIENTATION=+